MSAVSALTRTTATARAHKAWSAAKLDPITLHECRYTFASLMIAAGVNAKALSEYMGHATITLTLDRYGQLMPGNEAEAVELLDAYLAREDTAAHPAAIRPETGTNTGTS
jgi:integrase